MTKLESLKIGYYVWQYVPSTAAASTFTLPFAIGGICESPFIHPCFYSLEVRIMMLTCLVFVEIIGYAARVDSHDNTGKLMLYCIQAVFILLGPALFAASIYMVLARIIRSVNAEKHSVLPLNWVTKTFVLSDIVTFLVQAGGCGMMVSSSLSSIGQGIVIAGLGLQVLSFCMFIVTAYVFQTRMRRKPTEEAFDIDLPWKQYLYSIYVIGTLVIIRSIFRIVEYAMGNEGYPLSNEWTLYVFDSLPMFASMVVFGIWYPGDLKPFLEKNYSPDPREQSLTMK
ncbi:RTA1 like protein [Penicillium malachiteum]|uniref:RTA1 like protein n=1 Tax=Penicillium malachiteum TaxID=1324776 RepID=UPI002547335F|nr:RTA1 like protein [Penicillium malachiteum]KAJ5731607.1 RTA1 like protein [Penicillium malachiteum]